MGVYITENKNTSPEKPFVFHHWHGLHTSGKVSQPDPGMGRYTPVRISLRCLEGMVTLETIFRVEKMQCF